MPEIAFAIQSGDESTYINIKILNLIDPILMNQGIRKSKCLDCKAVGYCWYKS